MTPLISICMIVKDEEDVIRTCLDSIRGIWDELIVVDTGSRDKTVDILKEEGAKIYFAKWEDDFSKSRNLALEKATGKWIFMIDADEFIVEEEKSLFKEYILSEKAYAYSVIIYNYTNLDHLDNWQPVPEKYLNYLPSHIRGYVPSDSVRIFRNLKSIKYTGCIHETVEPSLKTLGIQIHQFPYPLHHLGKIRDQKRLEQKYSLYEKLSEKKYYQNTCARTIYELAVQYMELKKYRKAFEFLLREYQKGIHDEDILFLLATAAENCQEYTHAKKFYEDGIKSYPESFRLNMNYGTFLAKQKRYQDALKYFNKTLQLKRTWYGLFNRALCLEHLNKLSEALDNLKEVYQLNKSYRVIISLARLYLRNGYYEECINLLNTHQLENSIAMRLRGIAYLTQNKKDMALKCLNSIPVEERTDVDKQLFSQIT